MYYGVAGYAEDLQAWEKDQAAWQAWEAARADLKRQWDQYAIDQKKAQQKCADDQAKYEAAIAERAEYAKRYEADRAACEDRQARIDVFLANVEAWKQRHGINANFDPPPCATTQQKQAWKSKCEQSTEIRGLGYVYQNVSQDPEFKTGLEPYLHGENAYCALADLPSCPEQLPRCEGLQVPGRIVAPTCKLPTPPPSLSTLPMPDYPGRRPTPPATPDTVPIPEDEEPSGSASFAMYGILVLLLAGGGYFVYRTVK